MSLYGTARRGRARLMSVALVAMTAAVAAACSAAPQQEPADLVLRNGRVVTVDSAQPEAQAVAIRGHSIVAVGSNAEIGAYVGTGTEVIDLAGRLAIPGFIEGHGHYMGLGQAKMNLDLMNVRTGTRSWAWSRPRHATRRAMRGSSAAAGTRRSGTACRSLRRGRAAAHVAGLRLAEQPGPADAREWPRRVREQARARPGGIDRNTPNPAGGEIVKDADGNPTGLLRETAQRLVGSARTRAESGRSVEDREAESRRAVELAAAEALSKGVTTFHDAGTGFETIDFLRGSRPRARCRSGSMS
jgi:predicted amidohydrolase YtcJ